MFSDSPFKQTAPKPPPKKKPVYKNPYESLTEQAKAAGQTLTDAPKDIGQAAVDNMWAALYGVSEDGMYTKKEEDPLKEQAMKYGSTKIDFAKLEAAYARNDQKSATHWQEKLNDDLETEQLNQAAHKAYDQEYQRAIQQKKAEEEEKKRREAEEEQMKKQQEEEERAAAMNDMAGAGAGKSKSQNGARVKASTETNFEASKGRTGK